MTELEEKTLLRFQLLCTDLIQASAQLGVNLQSLLTRAVNLMDGQLATYMIARIKQREAEGADRG